MSALKELGKTLIPLTKYPLPVRWCLNQSGTEYDISVSPSVDIARGCELYADINIRSGAKLKKKCKFSGNIEIRERATIGEHSKLSGSITVGKGTNLVRKNELIGEVSLGRYNAIGPHTIFQQPNHVTGMPSQQVKFYREALDSDLGHTDQGPIVVENDVWIGVRSTILSGVRIGSGAIVGADSVVTRDVEPYEIVAGVPAERIGWRFSEDIRKALLDVSWWEWENDKIAQNREFFVNQIESVSDVYDRVS